MHPSAISLYTVGYNIASFALQPTLFALARTFARFGRHVTRRDQSRPAVSFYLSLAMYMYER
jgi:hypothetical protein